MKLSSNENPFPPLPSVVRAAADAAERLPLYPDATAAELTALLAGRLDVAPEQICWGAGSVSVLMHLLTAICSPGDEVVHPWRSFEAYPLAVAVAGATAVPVPLLPDGRHDLDAMLDAVTPRTRAVLVCSPNNPTGPTLRHDDVRRLQEALPGDVALVIDEAYIEFARATELPRSIELLDDPRVVVLRTLSKAWGLAGFRVGYGIADAGLIRGIRTVTPPFSVSVPAQAAAKAVLEEEAAVTERVETIVAERDRVADALRGLGLTVPDAQGNFVWLPTGNSTAWAEHFAQNGLIVRDYAPDGIRITIGMPDVNDRVIDAASRIPRR